LPHISKQESPLPTPTPSPSPESSRIIFLHHSVGRITYAYDVDDPFDGYVDSDCRDGDCDGLARWFCDYSRTHNRDYEIYEVEWPWGHGQNDPAVYESILVGDGCSEAAPKPGSEATRAEIGNVCSVEDLDGFDVIVFKTCFTESGIDSATRQRYMANYEALGQEFDRYPDKIFVAWNLFPNLSGTPDDRQFSEWLRDTWAPQHRNVYVWDVFEYMTYGTSNSFYSAYAWGDNHPTPQAGELLALGGVSAAGETVVGLGDFIVNSIADSHASVWRPFSDDSPWNTTIGDDPSIDPDSDAYIGHINQRCPNCPVGCAIGIWTIPVYFIENLDPYPDEILVPSHTGWGQALSAPIPDFARPDPSADAHLCIIDRDTGDEWDFWEVRGTYPDYTSGTGKPYDVSGSGVRAPYEGGCRGAGFPLIAGLIRPEEIQAGEIRHALVYAFDARGPSDQFVSPASIGQSGGNPALDVLPFGAQLQLKPDADISGFPRGARIVAQAMKDYGMFLGDRNDAQSIGIYFQLEGGPDSWIGIFGWEDREALATLTSSDFRVIRLPPIGGQPP
jgi:hypothetical protein